MASKNDLERARERWLQELTHQGRVRRLEQYSDEELAIEFAPMTAGYFAKERQKIGERPTTAEKVAKLEATPRKKTLRVKADMMDKQSAILEIIDNSVDNYFQCRKEGYDKPLEVHLRIFEDEVMIFENSGGIRPQNLLAFVAIGVEGHEKGAATIGVWSEAQKIAFYALGNETVIASKYWVEDAKYELNDKPLPAVALRLDREWYLDDTNWDVPVYRPGKDPTGGQTHISVQQLRGPFSPEQIESLRKRLTDVYSDLIVDMEKRGFPVSILVNDTPIEVKPTLTNEAIIAKFAHMPGIEPVWVEDRIDETVDGRQVTLDVQVLAGVTVDYDKPNAGVYMWGAPGVDPENRLGPRLFEQRYRDSGVGHGDHGNRLLNWNDGTLGRLQIYVVFRGRSIDIPWKGPTKWEYSSTNPVAEQIRGLIKEVGDHYARLVRAVTDLDLLPFSDSWNERTTSARRSWVMGQVPGLRDDPQEAEELITILPHTFFHDFIRPTDLQRMTRKDFRGWTQKVDQFELASRIKERREAVQSKSNSLQVKMDAVAEFIKFLFPGTPQEEEAAEKHEEKVLESTIVTTVNEDTQLEKRISEGETSAPPAAIRRSPLSPTTPWGGSQGSSARPGKQRTISCKISPEEVAQLGQVTGLTTPSEMLRTAIGSYLELFSAAPERLWADLMERTGHTSKAALVRQALDTLSAQFSQSE